jgi:hypothetical protein
MYILVGQPPEVYTIGRDDTAKPPTATNKHVVAVGMHERQEALVPKWYFGE